MTSRSAAAATLIIASVMLAACGGDYPLQPLGPDSPQGKQINGMVEHLRRGGADALDDTLKEQAAPDLTPAQTDAVKFTLGKVIAAKSAPLTSLDRFGDRVYRAVFTLDSADGVKTLAVLLIADGEKLYWAGPN